MVRSHEEDLATLDLSWAGLMVRRVLARACQRAGADERAAVELRDGLRTYRAAPGVGVYHIALTEAALRALERQGATPPRREVVATDRMGAHAG